MEKIRIGVSSCLLGEKVRYDGQHKLDSYIAGVLSQWFEFVPVCPSLSWDWAFRAKPCGWKAIPMIPG